MANLPKRPWRLGLARSTPYRQIPFFTVQYRA
jgi:hypothetical protein